MDHRKLFLIIRYIAIFFMILSITLNEQNTIGYGAVIFILVFIINGQVRFNYLSKRVFILGSFFIELLILYYCYKEYGGIIIYYYLPTVIDTAYLLCKPLNYSVYFLGSVSIVLQGLRSSRPLNHETFLIGGVLVLILLLSEFIKGEYQEKVKAQTVYDQLRISEDKLKKAYLDLEEYASSIEELTLLKERNRISRDIHDSVGHSLSTIIIQLGAIEKLANESQTSIKNMSENLREFAKKSLEEVRVAVRELKPKDYDQYEGILGVEELIKNFKKLSGVDVRLKVSKNTWKLSSDQFGVVYRIVQEFLSNSIRHGKAKVIDVFMNFREDKLIMVLKDNGIGTDTVKAGMGLKGIQERLMEIGGDVEYSSQTGKGFYMKIDIDRAGGNTYEQNKGIASR
ncbi:signal transduction histidine kinase [Natranaerovirga pectinivora]|uniref:histidine kinase n=1 Tax=Natranaerovirga pectinivora TaxID=682400 RepID=A0A4R3MII2_9FIRM|nr:sensor histidine kinase [Natranaerovirga pectinivora]TCT12284.1 signal transduction histidine kinase [Natranaerovirga pectinivora]